MPPQKKPKPFSIFDTTSAPTAATKITAPSRPTPPPASAPTRPATTGTKQIKVDGVVYTVPADADERDYDDIVTQEAAATAQANRPLSEQAGALGGAASEASPRWEAIKQAVSDPLGTARGLAEGVTQIPAAFREAAAAAPGVPYDAVLGQMVAKKLVGPTVENVTKRVQAGDYSGAAGAGLTSLALDWLPVGKVAGVAGRGLASTGLGTAARVLNVPRQVAEPVLKEGFLKWGVGAGRRAAEGQALEAAAKATASAPTGMNYTSKSGGRGFTPEGMITQAEKRRLEGLGAVKEGTDPGSARAATPTARGQFWRNQVRPVLPAEGQAAIDRLNTLDPITATLANAPKRSITSSVVPAGVGYALGGPWTAAVGAAGSAARGLAAPIAHRLDRVGGVLGSGLTTEAMNAIQRAAILARLQGQDDDDR